MDDQALRKHLLFLLNESGAHAIFDAAIDGLPPELRGKRPAPGIQSVWELVEHLRIAQWDILEFVRNPDYVSPQWPDGYWPSTEAPPDEKAWEESVAAYRADLSAIAAMAADETVDLTAQLPHAPGYTVLREVLLVADHNAYHVAQIVMVRRLLGAWK